MSRPRNPRREVVRSLRRVRVQLGELTAQWNEPGGKGFDNLLENQATAWRALATNLAVTIQELEDLRIEALSQAQGLEYIASNRAMDADRAAPMAEEQGGQMIDEGELRRLVRLLKEADARLLEGYGNADWDWVLNAQCDVENITRDLCNLVGVTTNQDDITNRIRAASQKESTDDHS